MTTCSDLQAFADGELDRDRANAFRDHLRTCDVCQAGLIEALQLSAQITVLPVPSTLRGTWFDRLLIRVAPAWGRRRVRNRFMAGQARRYELEIDRLRGLIHDWARTKAEWEAAPQPQNETENVRYGLLYNAYWFAERRLKREAGVSTVETVSEQSWHDRVIAAISNGDS